MCKKYDRYGQLIQGNKYFINQLNELGIKQNFTGYYYAIDILDILINQGVRSKSFSKYIYPQVAKKYNKSECTIERNIRNLIDKNWNEELKAKLNCRFNDGEKPSCKELIFMIKDYIMSNLI